MSIFTVPISLTGPPRLHHGFWYSHGPIQTPGYMLTVSSSWATFIPLALGLLVGWAVSRLWRIACVTLFHFSVVKAPSWEESQNNVLLVNSKAALDGCIDSYDIMRGRSIAYSRVPYNSTQGNKPKPYRNAKHIIIATMVAALICVCLKLAIPSLISLIPISNYGTVFPKDCGYIPKLSMVDRIEIEIGKFFIRRGRWANAAFSMIDTVLTGNPADSSISPSGEAKDLPKAVESFDNSCPPDVPACSSEYPFTFTSAYNISSHHLGLNIDTPFTLHISNSCYRPRDVILSVDSSSATTPNPDNITAYYYGPFKVDTFETQKYTLAIDFALSVAGSYAVRSVEAVTNGEDHVNSWSPNTTLVQGGDTTMLLYYIGGLSMTQGNQDPMFATQPTNGHQYHALAMQVPIICDTKYVFCDTSKNSNGCSSPGGRTAVMNWLTEQNNTAWNDIQALLSRSLNHTPFYRATFGSVVALAAQSANHNTQWAGGTITAYAELSRLSTAGMVMIISFMQLAVVGYWNLGSGVQSIGNQASSDSICNKVIMESSAVATIPVIPYVLFITFSTIIVVISYLGSLRRLKRTLPSSIGRHFNAWILHTPGQLHKKLTESLRGREFGPQIFNASGKWPDMPYQSGPTVINRKGSEGFGSGNVGLPEDGQEEKTSTDSVAVV